MQYRWRNVVKKTRLQQCDNLIFENTKWCRYVVHESMYINSYSKNCWENFEDFLWTSFVPKHNDTYNQDISGQLTGHLCIRRGSDNIFNNWNCLKTLNKQQSENNRHGRKLYTSTCTIGKDWWTQVYISTSRRVEIATTSLWSFHKFHISVELEMDLYINLYI